MAGAIPQESHTESGLEYVPHDRPSLIGNGSFSRTTSSAGWRRSLLHGGTGKVELWNGNSAVEAAVTSGLLGDRIAGERSQWQPLRSTSSSMERFEVGFIVARLLTTRMLMYYAS